MIISDLNYLEVATEEVVGGGYSFIKVVDATFNNTAAIKFNATVTDTLTKVATYNVASTVTGNSASITFDNEAIGNNTNTQASFSQLVVAGESSNQSGILVAVAS
jgi:hypothetical protein